MLVKCECPSREVVEDASAGGRACGILHTSFLGSKPATLCKVAAIFVAVLVVVWHDFLGNKQMIIQGSMLTALQGWISLSVILVLVCLRFHVDFSNRQLVFLCSRCGFTIRSSTRATAVTRWI